MKKMRMMMLKSQNEVEICQSSLVVSRADPGSGGHGCQTAMFSIANNSVKKLSHKKYSYDPPKDQFWITTPKSPALDLPLVIRKSFEHLNHLCTTSCLQIVEKLLTLQRKCHRLWRIKNYFEKVKTNSRSFY